MNTITRFAAHAFRRETMTKRIFIAIVLLVFAVSAWGAQNPNTSRGFMPEGVYRYHGIDSINAFNGGLTLQIPLGQPYTAGDRLKYGFNLAYNSAIWNFEKRGSGGTIRTESVPLRVNNAGMGFLVTLGELVFHDQLAYVASDGSEHSFKSDRLHFGFDTRSSDDVLYSRDGSYLRLRKVISGGEHLRIVDSPDGVSREFVCIAECGSFVKYQTKFHLRRISDTYGNSLTIERDPEPQGFQPPGTEWKWTVKEMSEAGRQIEHYIRFVYNHHAPYRWVVGFLDLEVSVENFTPDQPISGVRRATYTFNYAQNEEGRAYRHPFHNATPAMTQIQSDSNAQIWVPILKSVTLPDDSKWEFQYHQSTGSEIKPPLPSTGQHYWRGVHDKLLEQVKHPTGGGIRYAYGTYLYPRRSCFNPQDPDRDPMPRAATSDGILTRQMLNRDGTEHGEPWRYVQSYLGDNTGQPDDYPYYCTGAHTFSNTIIDPLGNVTLNYFSIVVNIDNGVGGNPQHYGQPYAITMPDLLDNARRLSTKTFQCGTTNPFDPEHTPVNDIRVNAANPEPVCGPAKREVYVRFESSGVDCPPFDDENGPGCLSANNRLVSERIVYKDDGSSWKLTDNTEFDGLGHFRQMSVKGNFYSKNFPGTQQPARPHGDHKISRREWNDGVAFSANPETFTGFPAPNQNWVLETFTGSSTREERDTSDSSDTAAKGGTARVQYKFDERGFMTHVRTLKGNAPGGTDVLVTYERIDMGAGRYKTKERYFGGDGANLDTGPLGSLNPGNADYVLEVTYRFGTVERNEYTTCDGVPVLLVERNEIDPATGLILSSRDAANAITKFLYDRMGRLTLIDPPGNDANTTYEYTPGSAGAPATVLATRDDGTAEKQQSKWEFDPFGRVAAELKRLPNLGAQGNRWNRRDIRYLPTGWVSEETTTGLDGPTNAGVTKYTSYDAFGRPLEVVHPDHDPPTRSHITTHVYLGERSVTTTVNGAAVNSGANGTVTTVQLYDPHRRLVSVTEGGSQQTIYEYDTANRLFKVTAGTQTRTFDYDNRGFLMNEKHPELGPNGITYGTYDARGHAHDRYYNLPGGSRHELDVTYVYDSAERLKLVKQPKFGNRILKSFAYFENAAAGAHLLGKLRQTQRYNYVWDPTAIGNEKTIVVTETLNYWSTNHRLRSRRVSAPGVRMTTVFNYDKLGNISGVEYPAQSLNCAPGPSCPSVGPSRTVSSTYQYGFLQTMPGYLDSVSYHPNEMPFRVKHSNGVTWVQDVPQRNLTRATNIRLEGTSNQQNWNTGTYRYDALGNIFKIDNDRFTYDTIGRLTKAEMSDLTQDFQYDRHGNVTNFAGQALSPNASTNQLPLSIATYDIAGNVLTYKDPRQTKYEYKYEYDPFNMTRRWTGFNGTTQALGRMFLYDAGDERVAVIDYFGSRPSIKETWSARDHDQNVLRDFQRLYNPADPLPAGPATPANRGWTWVRDYVFNGPILVASVDGGGTTHVHVDHLGSERVTTNSSGAAGPVRTYRPFGEETVSTPDPIRLKFTGHERDDAGGDLLFGDLDYMHARYYNPLLGRFLTRDPILAAKLAEPQTWNKYTYALNNPLINIDRDGRDSFVVSRPLTPMRGYDSARAHLFIVTHAKFPGDPNGRVHSFGETQNGNMGRVDRNTTGSASEGTHVTDINAWMSLNPKLDQNGNPVAVTKIDAPDDVVAANAQAVMGNAEYQEVPGVEPGAGLNSNSAAIAVAEESSGKKVDPPGGRSAPGAGKSDEVQFDRNRDGKADQRRFQRDRQQKKHEPPPPKKPRHPA